MIAHAIARPIPEEPLHEYERVVSKAAVLLTGVSRRRFNDNTVSGDELALPLGFLHHALRYPVLDGPTGGGVFNLAHCTTIF